MRCEVNVAGYGKVKYLTTGVPGETWQGGEADYQVEDGPAHDDAVVDVEETDEDHGGHSSAAQQGTQTTYQRHAALAQVLPDCHLQHEDGDPTQQHRYEVHDQERPCHISLEGFYFWDNA